MSRLGLASLNQPLSLPSANETHKVTVDLPLSNTVAS